MSAGSSGLDQTPHLVKLRFETIREIQRSGEKDLAIRQAGSGGSSVLLLFTSRNLKVLLGRLNELQGNPREDRTPVAGQTGHREVRVARKQLVADVAQC